MIQFIKDLSIELITFLILVGLYGFLLIWSIIKARIILFKIKPKHNSFFLPYYLSNWMLYLSRLVIFSFFVYLTVSIEITKETLKMEFLAIS